MRDDSKLEERVWRAVGDDDHPNICRLWDVVETETHKGYVMELGRTDVLSHLRTKGLGSPLLLASDATNDSGAANLVECRNFARQLLLALRHIHSKGVVHCDIKLENSLLDATDTLKVIDFGLSRFVPPGGVPGGLCGTRRYCAPELLGGQNYGTAVDIWAFGVCVYVMITGQFPFKDTSPLLIRADAQ